MRAKRRRVRVHSLHARFDSLLRIDCGMKDFPFDEPDSTRCHLSPLQDGERNSPRVAWSFGEDRARGIRGDHGSVRVWKIDLNESDRLPGYTFIRDLRAQRAER